MKREMYYPSCGKGKIYACIWEPEGSVKGIIQIVHGISEHIGRYEDFAQYLNRYGYLVAGEDHMGHGKSADDSSLGQFTGGWHTVAKDTVSLYTQLKTAYPDVPYILFGHSMGSFISRTVLCYDEIKLDACILSGTAWMPAPVLLAGKTICTLHCKRKGDDSKSQKLQDLMFSGYNRRIKNPQSDYDWLTTQTAIVADYGNDPQCGFLVSAGLLRDMLTGLLYIQKTANLQKMDKTLPVHFIAGEEDPVGDYGAGVRKAYKKFCKVGMKNVTCKLYPGRRHELLNEDIKEEVYEHILDYISSAK